MTAKVSLTLTPGQFDALREAIDTSIEAWDVVLKSDERTPGEKSQIRVKIMELKRLKEVLR